MIAHNLALGGDTMEMLRAVLDTMGREIDAVVRYPTPIHLQPAYAGRLRGSDALPETERSACAARRRMPVTFFHANLQSGPGSCV